MGELQVLKGERDVAVAEAKAVRQTTLELEGEKKVRGHIYTHTWDTGHTHTHRDI